MRRAAKVDANQAEIVKALRKIGATVQSLAQIGSGCPDLLCGYRGLNLLLEVKDGQKAPSRRRLNSEQELWAKYWEGQVSVVESPEEAIAVLSGRVR